MRPRDLFKRIPQLAGIFLRARSFVSFISQPLNEFAILRIYDVRVSFQIEEGKCADWQAWH